MVMLKSNSEVKRMTTITGKLESFMIFLISEGLYWHELEPVQLYGIFSSFMTQLGELVQPVKEN